MVNLKKYGDIVLFGVIPIKVVKTLTHTVGNATVGHGVGSKVRLFQAISSPPPEKIHMQCSFLGTDRYTKKLALEALYAAKIPFPFISGITALPLVTISTLSFTQSANRKSLDGLGAVIDFTVILEEFKLSGWLKWIKLGVKLAWLAWTLVTHPDRKTKKKLYATPPDASQLSAVVTTEYITAKSVDTETTENLGTETSKWNTSQLNIANTLNKRFDKLPFNPNGIFPQVIKLQYPSTPTHYTDFNNLKNLPSDYSGYRFPTYLPSHTTQLVIKILPKETENGSYVSLVVETEAGIILFSRKIVPQVNYKISKYYLTFNEIEIKTDNINPKNQSGGSYGSKIEGGIRIA